MKNSGGMVAIILAGTTLSGIGKEKQSSKEVAETSPGFRSLSYMRSYIYIYTYTLKSFECMCHNVIWFS